MTSMRVAFVLVALGVAVLAEDKYTTKYDNVNLDEILNNDRLYDQYFKCLTVPNAKCTPDGKLLKETIPDALTTECKKCSDKQKEGAEKVIRFMLEKKPEDYKKIETIYDPEGIFRKKYDSELKKVQN